MLLHLLRFDAIDDIRYAMVVTCHTMTYAADMLPQRILQPLMMMLPPCCRRRRYADY